ncbi:MAG: dihydroorotase [bacterium]
MDLLVKGARVVDPAKRIDKKLDVLIENSKIAKIAPKIIKKANTRVIDATGKILIPGIIDMHTHLREPGREDVETIATGTRAAAAGGITSVVCMPNTQPVIDNQAEVELVLNKAQKQGLVRVFVVGAITKGLKGEEMSPIGELHQAGAVAISNDGNPVMNSQIMRRALEYSKMFKLPVISHCEDLDLSKDGVMNEGYNSTILGLRGIPRESEEVMVARDIKLAEMTGGHLHIAHVSTKDSVELIRKAKKQKIKVSAETCPHYFTLTDDAVKTFDTNTKMKPPLRTKEDVKAIKKGLKDGTIDVIATDHAPHLDTEKNQEYDLAPFGIIGLETLLPLIMTELVEQKVLSLSEAIRKITINPARILNLHSGSLAVGGQADITIIDPNLTKTIKEFKSKSKNSPFIGRKLKGFASMTIVGGKIVMHEGEIPKGL